MPTAQRRRLARVWSNHAAVGRGAIHSIEEYPEQLYSPSIRRAVRANQGS
jgi:hypothetical protein